MPEISTMNPVVMASYDDGMVIRELVTSTVFRDSFFLVVRRSRDRKIISSVGLDDGSAKWLLKELPFTRKAMGFEQSN